MPFEGFHITRVAHFTGQTSELLSKLPSQNPLAVFGSPHKVTLQLINAMARFKILFHNASRLNFSTKGESFSPNSRRRKQN